MATDDALVKVGTIMDKYYNPNNYCEVCSKKIRLMTPPRKGICSENCLKIADSREASI